MRKLNEFGRSMVEMLGALAIIGVLSVGGIIMYSYAMDKHRANETIKDVTLYAMSASQQMLVGQEKLNFSELGYVSSIGYPIDGEILEEDDRYFEIYVDDIPSSVCERIVDSGWQAPLAIYVNDIAYVDSNHICTVGGKEETVDMAFQFTSDLNQGAFPFGTCETASDCIGNCAACEDGLCVSACENDELCLKSSKTGDMICCSSENKSGPYCCPSTKNGMCCDDNGENCCPWTRPLADKNGNCYVCNYENGVAVTGVEDNCNVCEEREVVGNSCVLKCPYDKPFRNRDGKCFGCEDPTQAMSSEKLAKECVNKCTEKGYARTAVRHYCAPKCEEGYVQDTYGNCRKCENLNYAEINGAPLDLCELCGEDFTLYEGSDVCVRNCPDGQFRADNGVCYDCNDETVYSTRGLVKNSYCEQVCPNDRVIVPYYASNSSYSLYCAKKCDYGEYMDWDGYCHSCETGPNKKASETECAKCTNRRLGTTGSEKDLCIADCKDNEFRGADGVCYSCTEPNPIEYAGQCASLCPNRVVNGANNKHCSLPCPDGTFANDESECVSCDADYNVGLYGQEYARAECGKCGDTRNLYYSTWSGYLCTPKCPSETPLRGANNRCYACDTEEKVDMESYIGICETECPNERKMDGGYCVLK